MLLLLLVFGTGLGSAAKAQSRFLQDDKKPKRNLLFFWKNKQEGQILGRRARKAVKLARRQEPKGHNSPYYQYSEGIFANEYINKFSRQPLIWVRAKPANPNSVLQENYRQVEPVFPAINQRAWPSRGFTDIDYNKLLMANIYIAPNNSDFSILAEFIRPRTYVQDPFKDPNSAYQKLDFLREDYQSLIPTFQAGVRYWLR